MKYISFVLVLLISSSLFAKTKVSSKKRTPNQVNLLQKRSTASIDQIGAKDRCSKEFEKIILDQGTLNSWDRIADPQPQTFLYRAPTLDLGKWVEILFNKDEVVLVRVMTGVQDKTFKKKESTSCRMEQTVTPKTKFNSKGLTDKELEKIISSSKGMIYIWSPRMTYSMSELHVFEKAAKNLKIQFHAYADPGPEDEMIKLAQEKYGIKSQYTKRVTSFEMRMRQYENHFPRTFVYSKGIIHNEFITGVMPELEAITRVKERLNELPK